MTFTRLLIQDVAVQRRSTTTYVDGTPVRGNYTTVATYSGRLSTGSGGETITANSNQREAFRAGRVFLPPEAQVLPSDILLIEGVLYEVVYPRLINNSFGPHHVEADVRLVSMT